MSCCVNSNANRYAGSGGGGAMLKKKYANKFNKVSSNTMFSLNGNTNHSYIGNPNSVNSHDPFSNVSQNKCCDTKKVNVSTKSSKGYLNAKLRCSPLNSASCYKTVNYALVDVSLNKHLRSENRDQSLHISNVRSQCGLISVIEVSNNVCSSECNNRINRNTGASSRIEYLKRLNNTVKDRNIINGFTPGYDIYYGDSTLYKKKASCNLYNPPDAKVIAC